MEILFIIVILACIAYYVFRPTSKKELDKFKDNDNWSNMGF